MDIEYKKLVDNFRMSIRRRQIDQIFQARRQQVLKQQLDEYKSELYEKLQTSEQRQQWVHQTALKLADLPNREWYSILKNIYYAVALYENDHQSWIRNGIINSICQVYKPEYRYLGFSKLVSNIMTDIFALNSKQMHHQKMIKQLMNVKFIEQVINLMIQTQQIEYIKLMGMLFNSVSNMRNYFIDLGCLQFIKRRCEKIRQNNLPSSQYMYALLFMIFGMLKVHKFDKNTYCKPKKNTIMQLMPILSRQIQNKHTINNMNMILKSIKQICKTQQQQMYEQILKNENLLKMPLQMLCYQNRAQIRQISAKILAYFLMTNNIKNIRYLIDKDILNKIYDSYRLKGNKNRIQQNYLSILSNITADIMQFKQIVLYHPIMTQIIIHQAQYSYCQEIRRQAVYCICNILTNFQQKWVHKLFNQLNIFDCLASNITRSDRDVYTVKDILQTWKNMIIDCSKNVQNINDNFVYMLLKNHYGIQDILCQLNQSDQLNQQIMIFLDFFNNLSQ